jgi:hypothetical protein
MPKKSAAQLDSEIAVARMIGRHVASKWRPPIRRVR